MAQTIGKLPNRPFLPLPPEQRRAVFARLQGTPQERGLQDQVDALFYWAHRFHDAIGTSFFDTLSKLLVFNTTNTGTAAFGAADTSKAVTFEGREPDTAYQLALSPNWNAALWWSAKTVTGFTINASAAPGGAGGSANWTVIR